jgi:anti-sigma factor RsiW
MQFHNENPDNDCSGLHAFLDGDLPSSEAAEFESHIIGCERCSEAFEIHQQLDGEFENLPSAPIELPKDFSKVVAANAESQVNGLRKSSERRTTVAIIGGLAVVLFVFLGVNIQPVISVLSFVVEGVGAIVSVIGGFIFNLCLGVVVILRVAATQAGISEFLIFSLVVVIFGSLGMLVLLRFGRSSMIREVKR